MSHHPKTLEEIRVTGLRALEQALGPADLIRFLQQFEHGHGNYSEARRSFANGTVDEIEREWKRSKATNE